MKIRRYMGSNTQEAILKVKMDLGNEAIILNTRKVRQRGLLKLFAKPMVEVLAAIDEDYGKRKDSDKAANKPVVKPQIKESVISNAFETKKQSNSDEKEEKITELENKVSSMEALMQKIYEKVKGSDDKANIAVTEKKLTNTSYEEVLQLFYDNLLKNEVEQKLAKKIIDKVKGTIGGSPSVNEVASVLYNVISSLLGKPRAIALRNDNKPTVVIFVGPTGVGKTTTLAKIAANYSLNHKKNIGLITADTYRIAAVEQLKTYAEILGMPVSVIYSPSEITDAINAYSDKDIILIDTAGRSYNNKSQFEELKSLVQNSNADDIFLVLSTTTSILNCREILKNYNFLRDYKLIFTKLDETPINGIILNTKYLANKSLSYFTMGQSVPDDIEVANIDKITKNLLGSIKK